MAEISKITLPTGSTYDIKDAAARSSIASIISAISGGISFVGETTTPLTDGATTAPIVINGNNFSPISGNMVVYGSREFLYDGNKWIELGDTSGLGSLAYKDSATMSSFAPSGTNSTPSFTGNEMTATGSYTPQGKVSFTNTNKTAAVSSTSGTVTYTPAGIVTAPNISVSAAGATTIVNSITDVGTLPSLTTSVSNETLTIGFSAGTLPSKGANTTVKTGDASYLATAPTFSGTGVRLVTGNISVPSAATFSGTLGTITVTGTPSGQVTAPTFTGTAVDIVVI